MKKLLTFCLLMTIAFSANAQSNEETIKFIEANLKKIVGQKDERGNLFTNVSFDGEKLITTQNIGSSESPNLYTRNHSNLNWENVKFRIYDDESLKSKIPGFERLWVSFEKPFRYKVNDGEVEEKKKANFYVPIDKVEDLKKAFLSVLPPQEIAKEPTSGKKPTEEETVGFIQRTLNSLKGTKSGSYVLTSYEFEKSSITYKSEGESGGTISTTYSLMNWDKLYKVETVEVGEFDILLWFSTPVKRQSTINGTERAATYVDAAQFKVPRDKYESLKKAFFRLTEIAKEQNKDPFAN